MEELEKFAKEWHDDGLYVNACTSGSTGAPKHIRLLKDDMRKSAEATNRFFGIDSGSVLVCPLSVSYIAGKMMYVRGDVAGCKVCFEEPSMTLLAGWKGGRISLLAIVAAQIPGLVKSGKAHLVDNVIVGGGVVSEKLEKQLAEAVENCYATYGMTETCSHVALRKLGRGERWYEGLPGYKFSVTDGERLVIENREISFGRLVTNDCVELDSDGRFAVLGRVDNVIVSGGVKIHPEEIEKRIADLFPGREYIVKGEQHELWGEECVLVVEGKEKIANEDSTMKEIRERVGKHKSPKRIEYVDEFERTSSGKIVRGSIKLENN